MRSYGNDVLRMCYLYVKDMQLAEDMFQETFLKVYEKMSTFQEKSSIKTWIMSVAMNTCRDYLKSAYHGRVVPMFEFAQEQLSTGEEFEGIEEREQAATVHQAVMELPDKFKDVVVCVYFREMSVEQTARELAISEGTVKSRLARAREKLKPVLERRLSDE